MYEIEILSENPKNNIYILRKTIFKMLFKVVQIEVGFALLFLIFRLTVLTLDEQISRIWQPNGIYLIGNIFIGLTNVVAFLRIALDWLGYYYIIKPGEIIFRRGVLGNTETVTPLLNIEWVKVRQGLIASLFNFGNLVIHSPLLEHDLILRDIPSPKKYQQHIFTHFKTSSSQVLRSASSRR